MRINIVSFMDTWECEEGDSNCIGRVSCIEIEYGRNRNGIFNWISCFHASVVNITYYKYQTIWHSVCRYIGRCIFKRTKLNDLLLGFQQIYIGYQSQIQREAASRYFWMSQCDVGSMNLYIVVFFQMLVFPLFWWWHKHGTY